MVIPNLTRGGAPYGLIENVVTDAARRGKGYATAILHAAAERAWAHDCYKIMLLTGSKEPATLRFYEKAGVRAVEDGFSDAAGWCERGDPLRRRVRKYQEAPRELGPDATDFDMKKFMDESWDGL